MVFNCLKTSHFHFFFQGKEVEITPSYMYLGVKFSGPHFSLRPAIQSRVSKGMGSLALLERQCFRHHFQDISSKLSLFDSLVYLTVLYGSVVWGPSLIAFDWVSIEQVQMFLLHCIIRCHRFTPHNIVLVKFGAHPLKITIIFQLIWFLHWLRGSMETCADPHRYFFWHIVLWWRL